MRKRTSPIWTTPKGKLEVIVKNAITFAEIIRELQLDPNGSGSRYRSLKERFREESIDYSHIASGQFANKGRKFTKEAIALEKVMIKNSTYSRGTLKKRLLRDGILKNECAICEQKGEWHGQKLVMVLDHINGVRDDHREENLRMLCPNCNSQQETFAGRSNKIPKPQCKKCETLVSRRSKTGLCPKCFDIFYKRKIKNRPPKEQLLKEIKETNYCAVGRKYGVSDNAIRKWLK